MRNLLNPKWLLLINTLPIVLVVFLYSSQYNVIKTLLSQESIKLWWIFGGAVAIIGLINFMYTILLIANRKQVPIFYGVLALMVYVPFLYLYGYYSSDIIPFNIPNWMVPDEMIIYLGTFLMPTLAYSLFILVVGLTKNPGQKNMVLKSFLFAVAIPVSWYLFSQILFSFSSLNIPEIGGHIITIFGIFNTLLFLFFITRGIYAIATKKGPGWSKYYTGIKFFVAIIFPLIGLALNNGELPGAPKISGSGIFGNFNSLWFYTLALINGTLVCVPNFSNQIYRLILFIARSISFSYTFYFFLVFLPYLPFSVIAIIALGTGFLMLTPLVLFVIHLNELSEDANFLSSFLSKKWLGILSFLSFLTIPLIITLTNLKDKYVLNETLDYIYSPDYSKEYNLNKKSLSRTLKTVNGHKQNSRNGFMGNQVPYLSTYYNWLVLDNLTLSKTKIGAIEKIFFGKTTSQQFNRTENLRNNNVDLTKITSTSQLDPDQNAWLSWVDMEITNSSGHSLREYATELNLPDGCWISDYYLYVGDRKEMGILAEKKTAMWIFSQIRNQNRDPGLLFYRTGNTVAFRVFPFAKDEVRKTGIQLIHKEPFTLNIDGQTVQLGNQEEQPTINQTSSADNQVIYISSEEKKKLPIVQRTPYYHFIWDTSIGNKENSELLVKNTAMFLTKHQLVNSAPSKISYTNTYITTKLMDPNWKTDISHQQYEGGFYLERAIKQILFEQVDNKKEYPIIVVVTNDLENSIVEKDFENFKLAFPERDLFYKIDDEGNLIPHSLINNPKEVFDYESEITFNDNVKAWPNAKQPQAFLPNNNEPSIIIKSTDIQLNDSQLKEKNWNSGLAMHGQYLAQTFAPSRSDKSWVNQVESSFRTKIMHPTTSYIVVENEAQKAMLLKKQKQALAGNKSLDLGDDPQRMSEPHMWILLFLFTFFLLLKFFKTKV